VVFGCDGFESTFAQCGNQVAVDIAVRPHLLRVPTAHLAVPEEKAIVVHHRQPGIAGTGFLDEPGPLLRIVALGLEEWNEVLVAKL
jgi:hypothetical protein